MANSDKNILITPNRNLSGQPDMSLTGFGNTTLSIKAPDGSLAGVDFVVGSSTTAFSINSNLGSRTSTRDKSVIFSVGDNSGISRLTAHENGDVYLTPLNGCVSVSGGGISLPSFAENNYPNGVPGQLIYDKTNKVPKIFDGVAWVRPSASLESVDQYWDNVVLLVKDGQTIDHKGRHQIYTSGNATPISESPPFKLNGVSWSLGQNSSSYIEYRNNLQDFALGHHTVWTVEMWINPTNQGNYAHFFVPGGQGAQGTFKAWWNNSSDWRPYMYTSPGLIVGAGGAQTIGNYYNGWYWLIFQRNGSDMRVWINGLVYEANSNGGTIPTSTPSGSRYTSSSVVSGAWSGESSPFYLDELRVTVGIARYYDSVTGAYPSVIPVQTESWPTMGI